MNIFGPPKGKGKPDSFLNRSPFYRNGFRTPDTPPHRSKNRRENKNAFNSIPVSPCEETDTDVKACKGFLL
jgi:hypothetical protein